MRHDMRQIGVLLMGLSLLRAGGVAAQPGVANVQVLTRSQVAGPKITLGDISIVDENEPEALRRRLQEIEIGTAPQPGQSRIVKLPYIKMRMRQNGIDPQNYAFSGAASVQVETVSQQVGAEIILEAARRYVLGAMPWDPQDVRLETDRPPRDVTIAAGDFSLRFALNGAMDWQGILLLTATIETKDSVIDIPLSFNLRRFGSAVVAGRVIERGQPVTPADVVERRIELTGSRESLVRNADELREVRAKQNIAPQQLIEERMVEKIPLIGRRTIVQAVYESAALRIVSRVEAREDGCLGDIIRVSNITSKKELQAEVVGSGIVRVVP